jgi:hypothetical protein
MGTCVLHWRVLGGRRFGSVIIMPLLDATAGGSCPGQCWRGGRDAHATTASNFVVGVEVLRHGKNLKVSLADFDSHGFSSCPD